MSRESEMTLEFIREVLTEKKFVSFNKIYLANFAISYSKKMIFRESTYSQNMKNCLLKRSINKLNRSQKLTNIYLIMEIVFLIKSFYSM